MISQNGGWCWLHFSETGDKHAQMLKFIKQLKVQVKKWLPCLLLLGDPNEQRKPHPQSKRFLSCVMNRTLKWLKLEESHTSPYLAEIQHFGSRFFSCSFLSITVCGDVAPPIASGQACRVKDGAECDPYEQIHEATSM